jgi:hypothetical protein
MNTFRMIFFTVLFGILASACEPGSESGAGGSGPGYDGVGDRTSSGTAGTNSTNRSK